MCQSAETRYYENIIRTKFPEVRFVNVRWRGQKHYLTVRLNAPNRDSRRVFEGIRLELWQNPNLIGNYFYYIYLTSWDDTKGTFRLNGYSNKSFKHLRRSLKHQKQPTLAFLEALRKRYSNFIQNDRLEQKWLSKLPPIYDPKI